MLLKLKVKTTPYNTAFENSLGIMMPLMGKGVVVLLHSTTISWKEPLSLFTEAKVAFVILIAVFLYFL